MRKYLDSLQYILDNGTWVENRTGIRTKRVSGMQTRYSMSDGFPAMTTKKLMWKAVVSELLWFIEGSGDERRLAEILHGTRDPEKRTIWTDNAEANYWKPKAKFDGDLGRVYGVQWRSWQTPVKYSDSDVYSVKVVDQLAEVIENIKAVRNDPTLSVARRLIVTAWNPGELDQMALPPCHMFFQFHVNGEKLDLQMYQRSCDALLGIPFNIASYSLLLHMVAQVTGFEPGDFIHDMGDVHIYENHLDAVTEQLSREPLPLAKLWLNPEVTDLFDFTMNDIKLIDYQSHPPIKAKMAV